MHNRTRQRTRAAEAAPLDLFAYNTNSKNLKNSALTVAWDSFIDHALMSKSGSHHGEPRNSPSRRERDSGNKDEKRAACEAAPSFYF
jgi:hypothetical protein